MSTGWHRGNLHRSRKSQLTDSDTPLNKGKEDRPNAVVIQHKKGDWLCVLDCAHR